MSHIAILGGGLVGRLMALQLVQRGFEISVFDKGSRMGEQSAAYVAAAMLAPTAEALESTPEVVALGQQSMALWHDLIAQFKTPVMMQQQGSLIVWHGQDKPLAIEFQHHIQRTHTEPVLTHWNAQQIAEHEPQLANRFHEGFYLPEEGQLDNRQVLNALADALDEWGVHCHWHTDCELADLHQQYDFNGMIDCRGLGAKARWNRQPENASQLRGIRGEVARVYAPELSLNRPVRLLHPRYPLYIAPKQQHLFVVGATQLESESKAAASVRSGLELLSALYAVHPAFGEAEIRELSVGVRPTLNHHNPEIRYHYESKLIEINGLFRHGFMISPAVTAAAVRLAVALFQGDEVPEYDVVSQLPFINISEEYES